MPVTNYYTANGHILGEASPKNPVRRYGPDALGSVASTFASATGALENAYRYKPYGAQLVKTGSAADPKFTWVGTLGYRQTGASWSELYVRARHSSPAVARWTTLDRNWPWLPGHVYANGCPAAVSDPAGDQIWRSTILLVGFTNSLGEATGQCRDRLTTALRKAHLKPGEIQDILDCITEHCLESKSLLDCLLHCAPKFVKLPDIKDLLGSYACCVAHSKNRFADPCDAKGRFFDQTACCDSEFCECMLEEPSAGLPDKHLCAAQECEIKVRDSAGCGDYTLPGHRGAA